jgi:hypothetical protein
MQPLPEIAQLRPPKRELLVAGVKFPEARAFRRTIRTKFLKELAPVLGYAHKHVRLFSPRLN